MGDKVLGVDFQRDNVDRLRDSGRQVIHGSATDPDFWERIDLACNRIKLIMLAMPNIQENSYAAAQLKALGYEGKIAAVAKYPDEIQQLEEAGANWEMDIYGGARHSFTSPDAASYGLENLRYDPQADARSWARMQSFFDELFR